MSMDFGVYESKLCSAGEAAASIKPGDHVFVGTACATPQTLLREMESFKVPRADVTIYSFLTDGAMPFAQGKPASKYRHKCFRFSSLKRRQKAEPGWLRLHLEGSVQGL